MNEALGGQLYIRPDFIDGDIWHGQAQDVGPVALKFSTFKICDFVTYNKDNIYKTENFDGEVVDVVLYEYVDYDKDEL
jgi:hypothetical protein